MSTYAELRELRDQVRALERRVTELERKGAQLGAALVAYEVCSVVGALVRWCLLPPSDEEWARMLAADLVDAGECEYDALDEEETAQFRDLIANPRGPTEALRRAMKRKR